MRKFFFYVLSCLPSSDFPIIVCLLVSNLIAFWFRAPSENAFPSSSPSTTFELPCYAAGLANLLAEAPSPPPSRIRPFNKLVEDYLDVEADEGEDSDRHGSPSS